MSRRLAVVRVAGLLPYAEGLARQAALAAQRARDGATDTLLLCEVRAPLRPVLRSTRQHRR